MALRWLEGFETLGNTVSNAAASRKYDTANSAGSTLSATARSGSKGWGRTTGNNGGQRLIKTIDAQATWIVGCAHYTASTSFSNEFLGVMDAGTLQCEVGINVTSKKLEIRRNGTVLATGATILQLSQYYFVELKVTIADAGGTADLHLNGVSDATFTGDTKNTANASANQIFLGDNASQNLGWWDDWYACDGTGSINNDFLGDVKVELLVPTGAGNSTQFTPSTGSNWQNVDEALSNDDTDYNSSATAAQKDTFATSDLATASGTVKGMMQTVVFRKDDAGGRTIRTVVRSGATDYTGTTTTVLDTYSGVYHVREVDPATSAAWTIANVNAVQVGYELVS